MPCTWQAMVPLALILGVFYFLIIMPQRKRERKRKEMLAEVKKHDRVMTIGGIVGVVYSVTDDEVVLKVDEKNDVRLRFARSAVNRIIGGEDDDTRTDARLPHEDEK
ncbi:MAG: preprotein translocase subunit YajC [Phycisphaerae bacterium]|nr:preprotein translocase subunit YajC [Phycisphaerae bacterium]